MKKIKLFALTLLCLSFALSVSGQTYDETKGLITSVDQLSSPWTRSGSHYALDNMLDGDPSTYWCSETSGTPMGTQYFQVELYDEYGMLLFVFTRRSTATDDHITLWGIYGVPSDNLDATKDECTFLAERSTPYGSSDETLASLPFDSKGFTNLRFYIENTITPDKGYGHVAEFQLYESLDEYSEFDLALLELQDVYLNYRDYRYTFTVGTDPGEYDAAAVEAFYAALDAAGTAIDDPDASSIYTLDDILKMQQDLVDTYEAVLASQVMATMGLADGYYFFTSGGDDYTDYDEDGEAIVDSEGNKVVQTKAMYSDMQSLSSIYARWDTFEETCPFLWKVTDMGNREYSVVNVATGATFAQVHSGASVEMLTDSETLEENLIVFEYGDDGFTDYAYMIINWQQGTSNHYLHCTPTDGSHGYVVGGDNTSASSRWYPVSVSEEKAQAIIDDYSGIQGQIDDAVAMMDDAEEKMAIADSKRKDYRNGLIVSVDQLSSTPTTSGHGVDKLIDGDTSTYWRTEGSEGGGTPMGTQYLQAVLPYECDQICFRFTRRASATRDWTTQWGVYGVPSNNPNAEKYECTFLAEIYTPYGSSSETLTSDLFDTKGFTTIRFYIDGTTDEENGYTHMAEFQIFEGFVTGLITSADQLTSSPTTSGHGPDQLLDGDASTYWRTEGSEGLGTEMGTQYLQAELPYECDNVYFEFTYRATGTRDFPTQWGIYGVPSNRPSAEKYDCTYLTEIYTPYDEEVSTVKTETFDTQGFTILRFYVDGTTNEENGYTHLGEFQIYDPSIDRETITQASVLGDVYTNMGVAIEAARNEVTGEGISSETYNALKDAYDAFIALFVDPTALRDALDEAETVKGVVAGTDPGYWTDISLAGDLSSLIAEADAYDDASVYTQSQNDTYTEALLSLVSAIYDSAIKVETGKWYMIRYATEEEIAENGWDTSSGAANDANEALYGKYVTVAEADSDDDFNYVEYMTEGDLSSICSGQSLYFDEMLDIVYDDYAKFRFINVGDTAYMVQNKATGLFLTTSGTHAAVSLTSHPSLFNVSAIGYGENLLAARTLDGESHNYLNAQLSHNLLITYSPTTAGSNSGFFIEDIGESVAADYDGTAFNLAMLYGAVRAYCYPVSITAVSGTMYGVYVDGTTLTLHPMEGNTAEPGQPFIYVYGDTASYDAEAESEPVPFTHGYDIEREAQASGKLVGMYYSDTVGSGKLVASGNTFIVSNSSTSLSANRAYINGDFSSDDVIVIEFSDETFDGIEQAVANVLLEGSIYSIDGKLLGKGNLNTVRSFGKGVYIINGVKVAVK